MIPIHPLAPLYKTSTIITAFIFHYLVHVNSYNKRHLPLSQGNLQYMSGPRIVPCGMPLIRGVGAFVEKKSFTATWNVLWVIKSLSQLIIVPPKPRFSSLENNLSWSIVSKALEIVGSSQLERVKLGVERGFTAVPWELSSTAS
jgi:hypothetical protein